MFVADGFFWVSLGWLLLFGCCCCCCLWAGGAFGRENAGVDLRLRFSTCQVKRFQQSTTPIIYFHVWCKKKEGRRCQAAKWGSRFATVVPE